MCQLLRFRLFLRSCSLDKHLKTFQSRKNSLSYYNYLGLLEKKRNTTIFYNIKKIWIFTWQKCNGTAFRYTLSCIVCSYFKTPCYTKCSLCFHIDLNILPLSPLLFRKWKTKSPPSLLTTAPVCAKLALQEMMLPVLCSPPLLGVPDIRYSF